MKDEKVEAVIRLYSYEPFVITTREFEGLEREIQARHMVGDLTLGDRIVARLLDEHRGRYHEAKEENEARGITPTKSLDLEKEVPRTVKGQ